MPLWLRRFIYLTFIVLFLIVAPLLALYSMGYRYHWTKRRLEPTGLLVVDGIPTDAVVRIDGMIRARTLPARIGGLGANEYTIRVERDGFRPWEEHTTIVSGQTTFLRDIFLVRDGDPVPELRGAIEHFTVSANRRWAAFTRRSAHVAELWVLDTTTGERSIVLRRGIADTIDDPFPNEWSSRRALLLVRDGTHLVIIDPASPTPNAVDRNLPGTPTTAHWELGSSTHLIVTSQGKLFRVARANGRAIELPGAVPAGPFGATAQFLFTVDASGDLLGTPFDSDLASLHIDLPTGIHPRAFVDSADGMLTLDAETPEARLDIRLSRNTVTERHGFGFSESPRDAHAFLWRTAAFEVWAEWGDPRIAHLLTRRDEPITAAAWHPTARYAFVATAHDCTAIGLRADAPRPTIPIANFDAISGIVPSADGATLFIVGRRGDVEALWRLPLQ